MRIANHETFLRDMLALSGVEWRVMDGAKLEDEFGLTDAYDHSEEFSVAALWSDRLAVRWTQTTGLGKDAFNSVVIEMWSFIGEDGVDWVKRCYTIGCEEETSV